MKKIIVAGDSTFDLPDEIIEKYDIKVMASYVNLGEKCLPDWPDVKQEDLLEYYKNTHTIPKTSAANIYDYVEFFKKYAEKDADLVFISKGSSVSSCYQNAVTASEEFDNVFVIDSQNLSAGSGILTVLAAKAKFENGKDLKEYLDNCVNKLDSSFVIETLDFLRAGGRCTAMQLFGANLLKIRPEVVVLNGKMTTGKKYRGQYEKVLMTYIDDRFSNVEQYDDEMLFVADTFLDEGLKSRIQEYIKQKGYFKQVVFTRAGSAVFCHCGPNTLGLFFLKK